MAKNPSSGLIPRRKEADPPALLTSARAWPAKDCPRMTVNTPTTPDTMAAPPPITIAVCTGSLVKKPGSKNAVNKKSMADHPTWATWTGSLPMECEHVAFGIAAITRTRP